MQLLRAYQSSQIPQTMPAFLQVVPYHEVIYRVRKGNIIQGNYDSSAIAVRIMEGSLVASPRIMPSH